MRESLRQWVLNGTPYEKASRVLSIGVWLTFTAVFQSWVNHSGSLRCYTLFLPRGACLLTADLMPFSDLKPLTAKYVYQVWQKEWDETGLVSVSFTKFYRNFQTNSYLFVIQGKKTLFWTDYILVTLIWHIPLFWEKKRLLFVLHAML